MTTPVAPQPNPLKSIVRSVVPFIESGIAAVIARFGFHASPQLVSEIVGIGGVGLSAALHALETKYSWVGVFLGYIGAPTYTPAPTKAQLSARIAELEATVASGEALSEERAAPSTPSSTVGATPTGPVAPPADAPAAPSTPVGVSDTATA